MKQEIQNIIDQLYEIGSIKFGEFKLKSGQISPFYIDLRIIVSYPKLLKLISIELFKLCQSKPDLLCSVPYAAIPLSFIISQEYDIPCLLKRKEQKQYGTGNLIEGVYKPNQKVIIIEDTVTSGLSIEETLLPLQSMGLQVEEVLTVMNREQGGYQNMKQMGLELYSLLKISEVAEYLQSQNKISLELKNMVLEYIKNNQITKQKEPIKDLSYDRLLNHKNLNIQKLTKIMLEKKSNLCLSADLTNKSQIIDLINKTGNDIVLVKLHCDIIDEFDQEFINKLLELKKQKNFMIFEDRKFADIGNTVKLQYQNGVFQIQKWADFVNCHSLAGKGTIENLENCFLVAKMSTVDNLLSKEYTQKTLEQAQYCCGFISQSRIYQDNYLYLTPGVQFNKSQNSDQQFNTIESVLIDNLSDIIIVGRGIYKSENPQQEAQKYREKGWQCYLQRLNK